MMVRINGLRTQVDAMYANMASPDMVGLNFGKATAEADIMSARAVASMIGGIPRVGMFPDGDAGFIGSVLSEGLFDIVEVPYGDDDLLEAAIGTGLPVSVRHTVSSPLDLEGIGSAGTAYTVLDLGDSPDLQSIRSLDGDFILSAGLIPGNVLSVVRDLSPYGVEAGQGVMTGGSLDPTKMTAFVYAARGDFEPIIEHH